MVILDMPLAPVVSLTTQGLLRTASVVIAVSIINPYLLVLAVICLVMMILIVNYGIAPMVESQKFNQMFFGPINQTFTMVINGLVSLRAYRQFDHFKIDFLEAIEKSANATFCYVAASRWIGLRLELLCNLFSFCTCLICFLMKDSYEDKE